MKAEEDRLLMAFCRGKVITQVEFPAPDKRRIQVASGSGLDISEPKAGAKGRIVRLLHQADNGAAPA